MNRRGGRGTVKGLLAVALVCGGRSSCFCFAPRTLGSRRHGLQLLSQTQPRTPKSSKPSPSSTSSSSPTSATPPPPTSSSSPLPSAPPPIDAPERAPSSALAQLSTSLSSPQFEILSCAATFIAATAYAVGTLDLPDAAEATLQQTESGISIFFAVEYVLRLLCASDRLRYVFSPLALIDLVSFLPTTMALIMPGSAEITRSGFSSLRLLRILRLQRFLVDFDSFAKLELALGLPPSKLKVSQLQFARVFSSLGTLLYISTGLIYDAEHDVNPQIPDFFTALYFGLCTLTTVGFGDIVPVTFNGRLVVCASILVGIGVIPLQIGELAESILKGEEDASESGRLRRELEKDEEELRLLRESERMWRGRYERVRTEYVRVMKETEGPDWNEAAGLLSIEATTNDDDDSRPDF